MEQEITNADLNAAVRGLGMWAMSSDQLVSLAEEHERLCNTGRDWFASRVIAKTARQVASVKRSWWCVPT